MTIRSLPTLRRSALALCLLLPGLAPADPETELPAPVAAEDPAFAPVAERRADGIMKDLDLDDPARAARVRRHVRNFIVETKNINEGSKVPEEDKQSRLEQARADLYSGFDAEKLDDTQRLAIKNGLSANHFRINYEAFLDLVPDLTDEQKAYIHDQLAEVCEEAILLNSGTEKGERFIKRRGRINNYLSDQGYDLKELSKQRNERIRSQRRAQ